MAQSAALDKIETVARAIEFLVQLTDEDVRSPEDALVEACALAEWLEPNAIVGYTTIDSRGHVATFQTAVYPRLPTFSKVHDVPIKRPYVGTCAQAICEGRTITCSNIATDLPIVLRNPKHFEGHAWRFFHVSNMGLFGIFCHAQH